jgi:CRP-like cAMP-binding protein
MDIRNLFKNNENIKDYSSGDIIFEQGKPGEYMYVIMEGEVDIQCSGRSVAKAVPGETLGEMALVDKEYRSATAIALTDCKLVEVDERQFEFLVQQTPYFAIQVMKMMTKRLRCMDVCAEENL